MSERGILFSDAVVLAILDGRKTQTRRVIRNPERLHGLMHADKACAWCPYGKPGDRLWVRETWLHNDDHNCDGVGCDNGDHCYYRASEANPDMFLRWRPSIHMPRWASRITLEVTGVRVQRVQEISHDDALAEGCLGSDWVSSSPHCSGPHTDAGVLPDEEFRELWDFINAKRGHGWDKNPWVWVIEFNVL